MYVVLDHVDECLYKKYMQWSHNAYRNYKQMYIDILTSKIQFVWCYTISVGVCARTLLHRGLVYYKKVPYLITSAWPNCTKHAHMCPDCVTVHGKTQSYTAKVNMLPGPLYLQMYINSRHCCCICDHLYIYHVLNDSREQNLFTGLWWHLSFC